MSAEKHSRKRKQLNKPVTESKFKAIKQKVILLSFRTAMHSH